MTTGIETDAEAVPVEPTPDRLIRLPEVMARVGLRRTAIYQRMREGRFPKSRSLGPRCTVWVEAEIDDWIGSVVERTDEICQNTPRISR
ncbi:AlpA family transcriptional regulator [Qipengyuania sp. CAU 1752]|uniref:AlpA family transcriptional regulator n=2 Tax=Erythrobacteraceae TaxID=335929 RepID=A0A7D4B7W2_9SPHN|nr:MULTISPECIES: AlpA family transcriptional regulator [Erythrobacteraceae]QKG71303.1 AlpA family transcriptional regulator [Erythrobacter mangrovi]QUL39382.1 AlpA family transcriptional regulator [Erythrobacter sp. JK5]WFL79101.1 AlpA family transcriptional regulator [Altererythrobacter sp. CAU 1644]